jgi:hypothetical protein
MERNPWKLATIGLAVVGTTALGTGLTTAWMLRPPAPAVAQEEAAQGPATLRYAAPVPAPRAVTPAPRAVTPAVARTTAPPVVRPVATTPEDCATGGDRALRIAKPGAVGALLGAGIGAAGGAIADGKAGKGALIGGIAGAALGSGYGAYKTKQECGAIFGNTFSDGAPAYSATAPQSAFADGSRITVYNAR